MGLYTFDQIKTTISFFYDSSLKYYLTLMSILIIIVITTFVFMHAIEIAAFGARIAGRMTKRVALGTTLTQTISTASRFLLIMFLPALAYLVESGISITNYLVLVIMAYILTFIVSIVIVFRVNQLQKFFQTVFHKYKHSTIPIALLKSIIIKKIDLEAYEFKNCDPFSLNKILLKKTFVSFLAYIFLITGFFISFMLAVLYPDSRLNLSQFTAVFHGFGAVIFAFYLDPMLSRSIDTHSDDISWLQNVYSILMGRMLSYLAVITLLLIFLLVQIYWS